MVHKIVGCKNHDTLPRSGRLKTVDSEAVLQAIEANPICSTQSVPGEYAVLQISVVCNFYDLSKILPNIASGY